MTIRVSLGQMINKQVPNGIIKHSLNDNINSYTLFYTVSALR
jgi:hypothetical protein